MAQKKVWTYISDTLCPI